MKPVGEQHVALKRDVLHPALLCVTGEMSGEDLVDRHQGASIDLQGFRRVNNSPKANLLLEPRIVYILVEMPHVDLRKVDVLRVELDPSEVLAKEQSSANT